MKTLLLIASFSLAAAAVAADGGTRGHGAKPSKFDLDLPSFGEIPKASNLNKPKVNNDGAVPTVDATSTAFAVVSVQHARSFVRTPTGNQPVGGALSAIPLSGKPHATETFTPALRIKSPQRSGGPIDLTVIDERGDLLMSSAGQLTFRGTKGDEVDYTVDWDPTPCRGGGDFQLLIRIAGQTLGTFPLKLVEK
jgi:hypothetical protein